MRHNTFLGIAAAGLCATVLIGYCACANRSPAQPPMPEPVRVAAPVAMPMAPSPGPAPSAPMPTANVACPSDADSKSVFEGWLAAHADRQGQTRVVDVLPAAPYRVTAVRFREEDAARFSNDPSQWSQLRIDCNRDGRDDQKWLLRNGDIYKVEDLGPDGATVGAPRYFNR